MAFQKGKTTNPGGRSSLKPWTDALRMEIAALSKEGLGAGLRQIARSVVISAAEGDKDAWREIGDRLEGKPMQNLTVIKDARTATDAELTAIIDEGDGGEGVAAPQTDSVVTH